VLGRRGGTAALSLTAALVVLAGALPLLPGPVTPRLAPRALVSGLAAIPPPGSGPAAWDLLVDQPASVSAATSAVTAASTATRAVSA
jgi:hypothetical protein